MISTCGHFFRMPPKKKQQQHWQPFRVIDACLGRICVVAWNSRHLKRSISGHFLTAWKNFVNQHEGARNLLSKKCFCFQPRTTWLNRQKQISNATKIFSLMWAATNWDHKKFYEFFCHPSIWALFDLLILNLKYPIHSSNTLMSNTQFSLVVCITHEGELINIYGV